MQLISLKLTNETANTFSYWKYKIVDKFKDESKSCSLFLLHNFPGLFPIYVCIEKYPFSYNGITMKNIFCGYWCQTNTVVKNGVEGVQVGILSGYFSSATIYLHEMVILECVMIDGR